MNFSDTTSAGTSSAQLLRKGALLVVALWLAVVAVLDARNAYAAAQERNWPIVKASISATEIRKSCDKGTGYKVSISYVYHSAGGVAGAGVTERPIGGCVDEGTALSLAKDNSVGTALRANVNPADPQASVDALVLANDASMFATVLSSGGALGLIGIAIASRRRASRGVNRTDG